MAPTSDERREVAKALLGDQMVTAIPQTRDGFEWMTYHEAAYRFWDMCRRVKSAANVDITNSTTSVLADLIDPTCSVVRRQAYTGGPQMYKTLWCCSECGYPLAESKYKGHRPFVEERFCPRCGSRVTRGGDGL